MPEILNAQTTEIGLVRASHFYYLHNALESDDATFQSPERIETGRFCSSFQYLRSKD